MKWLKELRDEFRQAKICPVCGEGFTRETWKPHGAVLITRRCRNGHTWKRPW